MLWVGHFDLTQSQGIPGQFQHAKFIDAVKKVIDTARRHNLGAGIQPANLDQAQEWMELGFNVISYGGDFSVYAAALSGAVNQLRKLAEHDTTAQP